MSSSAIYVVNTASSSVASGGTVPLGSTVRRFGCNLFQSGNTISASGTGYFDINANVTVSATAAGDYALTLYNNGTPVSGATAGATSAAADSVLNLSLCSVIRRGCACADPSELSLVLTGEGTVTNCAFVVAKL